MKYDKFEVEDFVVDEFFQEWVFFPNEENEKFWGLHQKNYPDQRDAILEAKGVLAAIKVKSKEEGLKTDELKQAKSDIMEVIKVVGRNSPEISKLERKSKTRSIWDSQWWKVAAMVSIVLLGTLYFTNQDGVQENETKTVSFIEKSTAKGQKSTITLPDGSVVKLNAETNLKIPKVFGIENRTVHLDGEAFFEVTKNPRKPFHVITGDVTTTVLGTSFNINAYKGKSEIDVAVATGKVSVNNKVKNDAVQLIPGERVVVKGMEMTQSTFDPEAVYGWKDGILVFNNERLDQIVKRLETWFDVEIIIETEETSEITYTGKFKNENLENILEAIKYSERFEFRKTGRKIIIY